MPHCPVCNQPLVQVEEAQVTAYSCPTCRGTWINAAALTRRTRLETDPNQPHMTLPPLTELADTVTHSNSTKPLTCPDCHQVMIKERFLTQIPVQIDRCESCSPHLARCRRTGPPHPPLLRIHRQSKRTASRAAAEPRSALPVADPTPPTTTYSSGTDGTQFAMNIGGAILNILVELLLNSGSRNRSRW